MDSNRNYLKASDEYISRLQDRLTQGDQSILARSCGMPLSKATMPVLISFCKCLSYPPGRTWTPWLEARFFAACLFFKYDMKADGRKPAEVILADCCKNDSSESASLKKDVVAVLSADMDDGAFVIRKLARIFSIIENHSPGCLSNLDLAKLMFDLSVWNKADDAFDSKRFEWAGKIFSSREENDEPVVADTNVD